jgi:glycosyltransferase involved in cell wall biosynthesis
MKNGVQQGRTRNYFSVVVPCYNSERTLPKCLSAIFESDFSDFEVVVVDDASVDKTVEIARLFPCQVVRRTQRGGAAAARNAGARAVCGQVLVFIDSDVVIRKNTLSLFTESLPPYAAVFGAYEQHSETNGLLSLYQNFYAHKTLVRRNNCVCFIVTRPDDFAKQARLKGHVTSKYPVVAQTDCYVIFRLTPQ